MGIKLNLPEKHVLRRATYQEVVKSGVILNLDGPGCIKRLWTVPTRESRRWETRRVFLKIYFDDEEKPSVCAPIGDFFGVMHGKPQYPINTPYICVQEQASFTSYFEMPFAKCARIEVDSDVETLVAFIADWEKYEEGSLQETRRFHAQWRRENPTESYGREYMILDAKGKGQLMGFFYGVRLNDNEDRWSHGGSENIYVDGEGETPSYIRGIGGEDTFGVGFGGVLHNPDTRLYQGMPCYFHEDVNEARTAHRVVGYRFFEHDKIEYNHSIQVRFGCMKNDICSTVYWYTDSKDEHFCDLPDHEHILPKTELPYGSIDHLKCGTGMWKLYGPYFNRDNRAMNVILPPETSDDCVLGEAADGMHDEDSRWVSDYSKSANLHHPKMVEYESFHNFVDFRHVFRPHKSRQVSPSPTEEGVAIAVTTLELERDMNVSLQITWDDALVLGVNDERFELGDHKSFFDTETVNVKLKAGANRIMIKQSNIKGQNFGSWTFNFQAKDENGNIIVPKI